MSLERVNLLKMKGERVLKALNWTIDAYCRRELSDEEFDEIWGILDNEFAEVRDVLYKHAE